MNKIIEIADYDLKWAIEFDRLKQFYSDNIKGAKYKIEHVGSTAVPGLCAKPIIDIVIIYYDKNDFDIIENQLENIGYIHRGDLGITDREVFKYEGEDTFMEHHLYVCLAGITALKNQIKFRDYLISHPKDAEDYGSLKKILAEINRNDRAAYCYQKTEFIVKILEKSGMMKREIDQIVKMNEI